MSKGKLIKWLLSFVGPLRWKMVGAVCLGILSNLAVVGIPVIGLLQVTAHLAGKTIEPLPLLFCLLGLGIMRGILRYGEQYLNHDVAFSLLAFLRQKIFQQLRLLGPARLTGVRSGDFITSITADVEALEVFFAHTISPFLIFIGTTIFTVGFLATYHWLLALILLLSLLFVGLVVPIWSYRSYEKVAANQSQAFVDLNQQVMENLQSLSTIRQYDLAAKKLTALTQQGRKLNQLSRKKLRQESQLTIAGEGGMLLATILILFAGIILGLAPAVTALGVVLSLSAFGPAFALAGLGNSLLVTFASGERIYRLFHETASITFSTIAQPVTAIDSVELEGVTFAYSKQPPVLQKLNLAIASGESIGIGGPSGSGKSTLLKLLQRYFDPQSGQLLINERPLQAYSEENLHQVIGSFEQKTFIFADTIANNILVGDPLATETAMIAAAKKAQLHDWIMSLSAGYETLIGGAKRQLSDGERQRIGLARLFLRDAPLLLLDEPTSSLDYLNELAILHSLHALAEEKTLLLVSHRPTTLSMTQRQYQLQKGRLVDGDIDQSSS